VPHYRDGKIQEICLGCKIDIVVVHWHTDDHSGVAPL
jgi:hypothetical protein